MNTEKTDFNETFEQLMDSLDAELGALMNQFHLLDETEASREKYISLMKLCEAKADEMHALRMLQRGPRREVVQ